MPKGDVPVTKEGSRVHSRYTSPGLSPQAKLRAGAAASPRSTPTGLLSSAVWERWSERPGAWRSMTGLHLLFQSWGQGLLCRPARSTAPPASTVAAGWEKLAALLRCLGPAATLWPRMPAVHPDDCIDAVTTKLPPPGRPAMASSDDEEERWPVELRSRWQLWIRLRRRYLRA